MLQRFFPNLARPGSSQRHTLSGFRKGSSHKQPCWGRVTQTSKQNVKEMGQGDSAVCLAWAMNSENPNNTNRTQENLSQKYGGSVSQRESSLAFKEGNTDAKSHTFGGQWLQELLWTLEPALLAFLPVNTWCFLLLLFSNMQPTCYMFHCQWYAYF